MSALTSWFHLALLRRSATVLVVVASTLSTPVAQAQSSEGDSTPPPEVSDLDVEINIAGEGFFEGLLSPLQANIKASLSIEQATAKELSESRLRQLHQRATAEIGEALEPFGYYRPQIRSDLDREGTKWTARYEIDPGARMLLSEVTLELDGPGSDDPGFVQAVSQFPLARGEPLSHAAYDRGKQNFLDYAAKAGFLDATFTTAELRIDLDRYTAAVALQLDTGPRYRFGPVELKQDVLDPELLQGFVTFETGDPFDLDELSQMQAALASSPYFQRVEVLPRQELAESLHVPIEVQLVPAAQQRWDLGLGYGTDTGPRGSAKLELRRINRRGHRGEAELLGSGIEQHFSARYLIPGAYPRTDVLTLTAAYSEERPDDTNTSETALLGVGLTRSRGRWREAFGLSYQRTDFEIGVDSGISELVVPEASWSRVRADDRIYTTHGERFELAARAADESLGSDASFFQVTVGAKAVRSLGDWIRVIGRVDLGHTWTSDLRRLPPRIRFFAGGDRSVRGFPYQDLGPRDSEGSVIGGESLATASIELDSLFLDLGKLGRWGAAVFYDIGGAAANLGDGLERGAGAGLRWLSPIGLVRADAAWALSAPGTPVRFHLMIGPDL